METTKGNLNRMLDSLYYLLSETESAKREHDMADNIRAMDRDVGRMTGLRAAIALIEAEIALE